LAEDIRGWERTALLAAGAALGVAGTALLIHAAKVSPEEAPRGWERTILLAMGASAGTLLTALAIHALKMRSP